MVQFNRIEAMETAVSSLFGPLRATAAADRPFQAEVTDTSIGPVAIAKMAYTPGVVRRLPKLISSDNPYRMVVILQGSGKSLLTQAGRQCQSSPGTLIACDTRYPSELACPVPSDSIAIAMPREMLGPSAELISRRTAVAVPCDQGLRSVIATFFNGLADTVLPDGEDRGLDGVRLADAAASLLVTAFTGVPCEQIELSTGLADQILSYTLANLHDPGLSVGSVARRFSISQRYLHALMRAQDVRFSSWVRLQRLKRIRQDLLDPRLTNWTVAAIAARWGINDPVHLSRALRAEYGCSAAEIRKTCSNIAPLATRPCPSPGPHASDQDT